MQMKATEFDTMGLFMRGAEVYAFKLIEINRPTIGQLLPGSPEV